MKKSKKLRIVTFDLETIWNINEWAQEERAFGMSNWEGRTMKADINSILCFGYQIHGEPAKCMSVWDFPKEYKNDMNDDSIVCGLAYNILKDADAIVTHNGKRFDWKFLQTRLKINGYPPLPKILHIDTCAVAKAEYSLFSNRLKDLAKFLKVTPKISTVGKQMWTRIYRGDKTAQKEMAAYCKQDVKTTTECAMAMLNVIRNWPTHSKDEKSCPNCGSNKVQRRGKRVQKNKTFNRYQCQDCGTWSSQLKDGSPLVSF
jgi:DNA polymerase elongation subunit (family B)